MCGGAILVVQPVEQRRSLAALRDELAERPRAVLVEEAGSVVVLERQQQIGNGGHVGFACDIDVNVDRRMGPTSMNPWPRLRQVTGRRGSSRVGDEERRGEALVGAAGPQPRAQLTRESGRRAEERVEGQHAAVVVVMVVFGREADAAEYLQRSLAGLSTVAAGERLHDLAVPRRRRYVERHSLVDHRLDRDAVGARPGQQVSNGLEAPDRLAELLAVGGVLDGECNGRPRRHRGSPPRSPTVRRTGSWLAPRRRRPRRGTSGPAPSRCRPRAERVGLALRPAVPGRRRRAARSMRRARDGRRSDVGRRGRRRPSARALDAWTGGRRWRRRRPPGARSTGDTAAPAGRRAPPMRRAFDLAPGTARRPPCGSRDRRGARGGPSSRVTRARRRRRRSTVLARLPRRTRPSRLPRRRPRPASSRQPQDLFGDRLELHLL